MKNIFFLQTLLGGGSYCDEMDQYDYYGKISTSMLDYNFRLALDPANVDPITQKSYTPHLEDNPLIDCSGTTLQVGNIETDGFYLNGKNMGLSCKNTVLYLNASDGLLLETAPGTIWDLEYRKKTKFDISSSNSCNADNGTAYHTD
jgi:hypothetical protein